LSDGIKSKIDNVINLVKVNDADADIEMIQRAFDLAKEAHKDQKRMSGELYIIHPVSVAYILAEFRMDVETIVAAILHDVIEDTDISYETVKKLFNQDIADLVDGVTKIGRIDFQSKEESQAENLRKMILAMAKDIRVVIIKLVDRLHNMRTLEYMKESKQIEKAKETLDIYAPIANRLGIQKLKGELEDLSLKYLDPKAYYDLVKKVKLKKRSRDDYINNVIEMIQEPLKKAGIAAKIYGRPKHFYSIYKKMKAQRKEFDEIYDLIAVRIIVETLPNCYAVIGAVHQIWNPIPGLFKDYIATPKPNNYQSIHTTVIGPSGEPFEIQVRTEEMHKVAEYGIAAHWKYKEGSKSKDNKFDEKIAWIRQIIEWQQEMESATDLMETVKVDFLNEEVYVFTPRGEVISLPQGACPLDFAYRIHSDVGNKCVGAKVNGRIVPLNYTLNNGDIIEILTSKNSNGPSRDWLKIVKSANSRNKIRQFFKKAEKDENITKGKHIVDRELKREGLQDSKLANVSEIEVVAEKMGYKNLNDFYAALGFGGIRFHTVFQKMQMIFPEEFPKPEEKEIIGTVEGKTTGLSDITVAGYSDIDVHFSKCCHPLPGDPVVGYITVGRGISVHRSDCKNVMNLKDPSRIVKVEWNKHGYLGTYHAELEIKAHVGVGITIEVQKVFIESNIRMTNISAYDANDGFTYIRIAFEVKNRRELSLMMNKINKIPQVITVSRL